MAYLSEIGQNTPMNKLELRGLLDEMFFRNPLLDNNFALAAARLTGGILGHPTLEEPSKEALQRKLQLLEVEPPGLLPVRFMLWFYGRVLWIRYLHQVALDNTLE